MLVFILVAAMIEAGRALLCSANQSLFILLFPFSGTDLLNRRIHVSQQSAGISHLLSLRYTPRS